GCGAKASSAASRYGSAASARRIAAVEKAGRGSWSDPVGCRGRLAADKSITGAVRLVPLRREAGRVDFAAVALERGDLRHVFVGQAQRLREQVAREVLALRRRRDHR